MQLIHHKVPRDFLEMLPEGMKFLNRHGKEFLVVERVTCPNGHSLMAETVRIHDEPSIRIAVERSGGDGHVFIDAYWGSHAKLFDFLADASRPIVDAHAKCPECGVSLLVNRACSRIGCGSAASIAFRLPGAGNVIYACARLGCPDHSIVVGGVPTTLTEAVSEINFFGEGEDDQFRGI